jgi:steroid 5-alpha reductase family enzyme
MNMLLTINLELMLQAVPVLLLLAFTTWLISLAIDDVSIVDYIWSLLSLAAAATYAYHTGIESTVSLVMLLMVFIWAIRLTFFLMKRGRNQPEDRRYQVIRKNNSPNFGYKSLYLIFIFQGFIAWIISVLFVPVFDAGASVDTALTWSLWHSAGVALWLFGLLFESIADNQLHAFNQKVVEDRKTLNTGLWRYCRHPNYFGEFCIWWAWFIFAIPTASLWILVAPLIMTYLLMKFSGVGNMETGITGRRPDYQAYIDSTNTFFPWKPRVKVNGDI